MNYYYYCAKIKEMMKLSKEKNEPEIFTLNGETLFVKYCEMYNDFTLQYSWIITDKDIHLDQEVKDVLSKFQSSAYDNLISQKIDVIQIGLITVNSQNEEELTAYIEHCKSFKLKETKDTNYIFCGKKILRVIQYYGRARYPLENLDSILKWNEPSIQCNIQGSKMSKITSEIDYNYSDAKGEIIFSIGYKNKKTTFVESIDKTIPALICIDTFLGVVEYDVTK